MIDILVSNTVLVVALLTLLWLISVVVKDASIIDIFWGAGFVFIAWNSWRLATGDPTRTLILALLATLWGVRLSAYLAWRNIGKGEDYRYKAMREKHGTRFPLRSLMTVFYLQGLIMLIVSLPIQSNATLAARFDWLNWLGVALWLIGLLFESIGDYQLARFKADPLNAGKVMDRGLWRYTRHPNYFGDFLVWWGIFLISATGSNLWVIVSPLLMSVFLMRVSGVTLLESSLKDTKPEYADYQLKTNAFFPWLPKQR